MTIRRHVVSDDGEVQRFEYDDPIEHDAVMTLYLHEFNLVEFDSWVLACPWEGPGDLCRAMELRAELLDDTIRGDMVEAMRLAGGLRAVMQRELVARVLRPMAIKGEEAERKLRRVKTLSAEYHGTTPEAIKSRQAIVAANPGKSLRRLAQELGVSKTTIDNDRKTAEK